MFHVLMARRKNKKWADGRGDKIVDLVWCSTLTLGGDIIFSSHGPDSASEPVLEHHIYWASHWWYCGVKGSEVMYSLKRK